MSDFLFGSSESVENIMGMCVNLSSWYFFVWYCLVRIFFFNYYPLVGLIFCLVDEKVW